MDQSLIEIIPADMLKLILLAAGEGLLPFIQANRGLKQKLLTNVFNLDELNFSDELHQNPCLLLLIQNSDHLYATVPSLVHWLSTHRPTSIEMRAPKTWETTRRTPKIKLRLQRSIRPAIYDKILQNNELFDAALDIKLTNGSTRQQHIIFLNLFMCLLPATYNFNHLITDTNLLREIATINSHILCLSHHSIERVTPIVFIKPQIIHALHPKHQKNKQLIQLAINRGLSPASFRHALPQAQVDNNIGSMWFSPCLAHYWDIAHYNTYATTPKDDAGNILQGLPHELLRLVCLQLEGHAFTNFSKTAKWTPKIGCLCAPYKALPAYNDILWNPDTYPHTFEEQEASCLPTIFPHHTPSHSLENAFNDLLIARMHGNGQLPPLPLPPAPPLPVPAAPTTAPTMTERNKTTNWYGNTPILLGISLVIAAFIILNSTQPEDNHTLFDLIFNGYTDRGRGDINASTTLVHHTAPLVENLMHSGISLHSPMR